ncbi:MAG TPA: DNA-3-methyladenine glycosylase I [Flavobacteriales bacterium]|nr:DNA-3-methyladenine glycosylase I [Flavobacteriales bacterium]HIN39403.1 DNA-3-methyladenine glycosylase I [Flavobacteriales bacterium]
MKRCEWVGDDPIYQNYHDYEWGVPVHDDQKIFEAIILDTFQAGLSWIIVLKKRENFRNAFAKFDARKIAKFNEGKVQELLNDKGIIRNKLKIRAAVSNASAFLEVQKEFGTFDKYIWSFTNQQTIKNKWTSMQEIPAKSVESDLMSNDLKKRGFKFIGSTICYAFMQAIGMVNDHVLNCHFR